MLSFLNKLWALKKKHFALNHLEMLKLKIKCCYHGIFLEKNAYIVYL